MAIIVTKICHHVPEFLLFLNKKAKIAKLINLIVPVKARKPQQVIFSPLYLTHSCKGILYHLKHA